MGDELYVGSVDDSYLYLVGIYGYLKTVDVSGEYDSMNSHTLYQQDQYLENVDVSCGNDFINIHTHFQCNEANVFMRRILMIKG